jgi:hypothetical protein
MKRFIAIGGLVAAGFDSSGAYLLTVSHSGRGVFATATWERVARDYDLSYPADGVSTGIGPIDGQAIPVTEMDFQKGSTRLTTADGKMTINCESSGISVEASDAQLVEK